MSEDTKKIIRVDIVDNDIDYRDGCDRIQETFYLVNPDIAKLNILQKLLNERYEENGNRFTDSFGAIADYIFENFETLDVKETIEIEW